MLKNILSLNGVKVLSKAEQRNISGGQGCNPDNECCYLCSCGTYGSFIIRPGQSCPYPVPNPCFNSAPNCV